MKDNGQKAFVQGYNVQVAVDAHAQIIVAAEITQQTTDRQQLVPLVKSVRSTAQATPETITADAGYWDTTSLLDPSLQGIQVLVRPYGTLMVSSRAHPLAPEVQLSIFPSCYFAGKRGKEPYPVAEAMHVQMITAWMVA